MPEESKMAQATARDVIRRILDFNFAYGPEITIEAKCHHGANGNTVFTQINLLINKEMVMGRPKYGRSYNDLLDEIGKWESIALRMTEKRWS